MKNIWNRVESAKERLQRWWDGNQAPRARMVALSLDRSLHSAEQAGSIGAVDTQNLRTGGGIFGSQTDQEELVLDELYGSDGKWCYEPHQPSLLLRAAAHVVVFFDGAAGIVSRYSREDWLWRNSWLRELKKSGKLDGS